MAFRVSVFSSRFDNNPSTAEFETFAAFAAEATREGHERRASKDGTGFTVATYRPGTTRAKSNVDLVYGIGLDIEHVTPERVEQLWTALEPLEHLRYTTHSHTPAAPRWRVIIPLTQPVPAAHHPRLWEAVVELAGADACDPQTKDASRLFYAPAAPAGAPAEMAYRPADGVNVFTLDPLDVLGLDQQQLEASVVVALAPSLAAPPAPVNIVDGMVEKPPALALRGRPSRADLEARARAISNSWAPAIEKLLAGAPFAQAGSRDATLFGLASSIAFVAPEAEVDDLAQLFEASITAMGVGATPSNPPPTMGQVREKLRRAVNDRRTRWIEERAFFNASAPPPTPVGPVVEGGSGQVIYLPSPTRAAAGSGPGQRKEAYSDEELTTFAERHEADVRDFVAGRLLIQLGDAYHVFGGRHGRYLPPVRANSVMRTLERDWKPFIEAGAVDLWREKVNKDGSTSRRKKTLDELVADYGAVARRGLVQLGLGESYYDPEDHLMVEAACSLRSDLQPAYSPEVHAWLTILGNDDSDKLLDWIATITHLDRQTAALYIEGTPGAGKTMLADGLARLWGRKLQPTPLGNILDTFNDSLMKCPLIFADEQIPGKRRSAELRQLIGSESRTLRRKFLDDSTMIGCIRLMMAANNDKLLGIADEEFSSNDIDAVGSRFIHITATKEAQHYLTSLGGREGTSDWVDGDRIARHALWLCANRAVKRGNRFLVEGSTGKMVRELVTRSPASAAVVEWLVNFCADGGKSMNDAGFGNLVRPGNGELLVSLDALRAKANWERYLDSTRMPVASDISRALENLSTDQKWLGAAGKRRCYYAVRPDFILGWARRHGAGDPFAIRQLIDAPTVAFSVVDPDAAIEKAPAPAAAASDHAQPAAAPAEKKEPTDT